MTRDGSRRFAGLDTDLSSSEVSALFSRFRHDLLGALQPLILDVDGLLEQAADGIAGRLEARFQRNFERLEAEVRGLTWLAEWLAGGQARHRPDGPAEAAAMFLKAARAGGLRVKVRYGKRRDWICVSMNGGASEAAAGCLLGSKTIAEGLAAGLSAWLAGSAWVLGRAHESRGGKLIPGRRSGGFWIRYVNGKGNIFL